MVTSRFTDRSEDEPRITKTTVDGPVANLTAVENNGSGNPSLRRGGMAGSLSLASSVARVTELTIAQHKGSSLVEWRTCQALGSALAVASQGFPVFPVRLCPDACLK